MSFASLTFALFLVSVFSVYWLLPPRPALRNALLLGASYAFYAWWDYRFCALMLISSLVDYVVGARIARSQRQATRRRLLLVSLGSNVGLLGVFKYYGFFTESFASLVGSLGWALRPFELEVVLPVGISFYTFQTLSYTIDIYRRKLEPAERLIDYLAFVSFFPQLVAGPIERASNLLPQFARHRPFSSAEAAEGCRQILWGFFKKVVLADNLAPIVDRCYANPDEASGPQLLVATFCFAWQIYCDFSGYSDIAIGTAKLFRVDLMRNFAYPYFSTSIDEFWRRWHISLSSWFRDYVYIPLGGSRAGLRVQLFAIIVTFVLSGFWHGASWNFIIWGALNGIAFLPTLMFRARGKRSPAVLPGNEGALPTPMVALKMTATFSFVCLTWIFFRAQTLPEAVEVLTSIATEIWSPAQYASIREILPRDIYGKASLGLLALFVVVEWRKRGHHHGLALAGWARPLRWGVYTGLLWLSLIVGTRATGQFIYFQF